MPSSGPYGIDKRVLQASYPTLRAALEAVSRSGVDMRPVRRDGRWVLVK